MENGEQEKRATSHLPKLPGHSNINFTSFHFKATTPAVQLICIKEYRLFAVKTNL
jgi:hypothetical protein